MKKKWSDLATAPDPSHSAPPGDPLCFTCPAPDLSELPEDVDDFESVPESVPFQSSPINPLSQHLICPTLEDFDRPPPPAKMLLRYSQADDSLHDFLPLGKVGLFIAPGGTGKTQALTQLAVAVATGRPWLDRFHPQGGPGGVLLALGEETRDEVQRRLWKAHSPNNKLSLPPDARAHYLANLHTLPLAGVPVQFLNRYSNPSPVFGSLRQLLTDKAPPGGWRLIILDPASRFMGLDTETDNHAATCFIQLAEQLTEAPGSPTVLLAHHTRKGSPSGKDWARGSSALTDGARWVASLQPYPKPDGETDNAEYNGLLALSLDKSNYTPRLPEPIPLRFDQNGSLVSTHRPRSQPKSKIKKTNNPTQEPKFTESDWT